MSRSIFTIVWIFIKVQKCYKKFKLCNCYIPLFTFYRISTKGKDGSKHRTTMFDTVLESWDFILFNEKILVTILGTEWYPKCTYKCGKFQKIDFFTTQKFDIMVPKMVAWWYQIFFALKSMKSQLSKIVYWMLSYDV